MYLYSCVFIYSRASTVYMTKKVVQRKVDLRHFNNTSVSLMMNPLGYNYNEWVTWQIYKLRVPHCKALWLSILVQWCSCMEQAIWGSKLVKISDHSKVNDGRASDTTPAHHRHHATIVRHRPFVTCEVIPSSRSLLIIATQHTERSSDYEIIFVVFRLYYNVKQTNDVCRYINFSSFMWIRHYCRGACLAL